MSSLLQSAYCLVNLMQYLLVYSAAHTQLLNIYLVCSFKTGINTRLLSRILKLYYVYRGSKITVKISLAPTQNNSKNVQ